MNQNGTVDSRIVTRYIKGGRLGDVLDSPDCTILVRSMVIQGKVTYHSLNGRLDKLI